MAVVAVTTRDLLHHSSASMFGSDSSGGSSSGGRVEEGGEGEEGLEHWGDGWVSQCGQLEMGTGTKGAYIPFRSMAKCTMLHAQNGSNRA